MNGQRCSYPSHGGCRRAATHLYIQTRQRSHLHRKTGTRHWYTATLPRCDRHPVQSPATVRPILHLTIRRIR